MGLIKVPRSSLEFFKLNLDEIFESGSLAEGPWTAKLSEFARTHCDVSYAIPTASNGSDTTSRKRFAKPICAVTSHT